MSVRAFRDAANIQYGGLYIPIASWLYIFQQTPSQVAFYATPIVLLGATLTHSVLYSIFGPEGPQTHPKKDLTVVGYSLALLYTKNPGGTPDTVNEFYDRLFNAFTFRRGIRFAVFLCLGAAYIILTFYSFAPLYRLSIAGETLVPSILLLTQTVFIVQGFMMNRFANVLPPEEAEWVWVPEFRRNEEVYSEEDYPDNEYRDPPLIFNDFNEWLEELKSPQESENRGDGEEADQ